MEIDKLMYNGSQDPTWLLKILTNLKMGLEVLEDWPSNCFDLDYFETTRSTGPTYNVVGLFCKNKFFANQGLNLRKTEGWAALYVGNIGVNKAPHVLIPLFGVDSQTTLFGGYGECKFDRELLPILLRINPDKIVNEHTLAVARFKYRIAQIETLLNFLGA